MRRILIPTTVLAVPLLFATACGGASPSAHGGATHYVSGGTFTMAVTLDPGVFDPYQNREILGTSVLAYDSLVNQRSDGKFVSGLAKTWTADANHATFTLRQGVTCSDGAALTASQIATDLNFVGDPKNSPAQYGTNVPTVPYTAVGDDAAGVVTVTMKTPYGFLLNTLGLVPIVCAGGMKDRTKLARGSDGTGPFVLTSAIPGQSYTFTVRRGYTWGPDGAGTAAPGTPSAVVLRVVSNETTAANLLLSGGLSFAKITGRDQQRLTASGLDKVDWTLAGAWLAFNQEAGRPTQDKAVRQALVGSLDPGQVIKVSSGGSGSAPTSLESLNPKPCTDDTVTGQLPKADPAAAGAVLDRAGWTRGADGIRSKDGRQLAINLHDWSTFSTFEQPTAELLTQQWRAAGFAVKLTGDNDTSAVQTLYQTGNWDVYLVGYDFNMPSQMVPYLSGVPAPNGDNISHIDNAEYNAAAAKAITMTPPDACPYWSAAERALLHDVDIAPISNRADHWFLRNAQARIQRYDAPVPTSIRMLG